MQISASGLPRKGNTETGHAARGISRRVMGCARFVAALLVFAVSFHSAPVQDEASAALTKARSLYFEARFRESVALLLPLDIALRSEAERLPEKIDIKLQLALAHIGLSEMSSAKSRFEEICELDANYELDSQRYAPKVISLFEEAKADLEKSRCWTVCAAAEKLVESGDAEGLLKLIQSDVSRCACLDKAAEDEAAELYERGQEAYKKNDLTTALEHFRTAAKFQPGHELAVPYIELIENQVRLAAEKSVLDWRAAFDAREYGLAVAIYQKLERSNAEDIASDALEKIREGYRQQLAPLIESVKKACASGDGALIESLRRQAEEFLPDRAVGKDLAAEIAACASSGCLQLNPENAMTRLITRDNPKAPKGMTRSTTVLARIRIDERGKVTEVDPQVIDPAIRSAAVAAAGTWKFLPATIENEARCVDTQIPIVFNP